MMSQLTTAKKNGCDQRVANCENGGTYTPRFDICEQSDELLIFGDLPGVEPGDLEVHFENGELRLTGRVTPRHADRRLLYGEYGVGDFHRSFAISEAVDASQISAELKHGVLTVHLPKANEVKPRRIEVQAV